MSKKYFAHIDQVKPVAVGLGPCIVSDQVSVDGKPIGRMFREEPKRKSMRESQ